MKLLKMFKKFYRKSEENRIQTFEIIGVIIPIIALSILFLLVIALLHTR